MDFIPNINNYTFEIKKINNTTFEAFVTTKDKIKFRAIFGSRIYPNNQMIFELFLTRPNTFCIDIECIDDSIRENHLAIQLYEKR